MKEKVVFTIALVVSIVYILVGNRIAMNNNKFFENNFKSEYPRAKVTRVIERKETPMLWMD